MMTAENTRRAVCRALKSCGCHALLLAVAMGAGCNTSDHRISLDDFLELQSRRTESARTLDTTELGGGADLGEVLGPYRVGTGDVLSVTLTGGDGVAILAQLRARVDGSGEIDLPTAGRVKVVDMNLVEVEAAVRRAYVPGAYQNAVCHVKLDIAEPTNVLVVGAITAPGLVPLRRTERNLLFAIVGAGGVSDIASGQATLRRIREPGTSVTFDLTDPSQLREALALDPLENGDIVQVAAAEPNTVYVGGLVNRGGPQVYPPGARITVLQALAAASGLRTDVTPKEGTLVRRMPDGSDVHVKLDLQQVATGEAPNLTLAAGDILWVPETAETRIQDFLNRNFFLRAGISVNYNVTGVEFLNRRSMQSSRLGGSNLQDSFDPLGFLTRNSLLQAIPTQKRQ